jgi:hypothetical protein
MARHPAFASGRTSFVRRPFVRGALCVRGFAALARNLALLGRVHRRESAIFLTHVSFFLEPWVSKRAAKDVIAIPECFCIQPVIDRWTRGTIGRKVH